MHVGERRGTGIEGMDDGVNGTSQRLAVRWGYGEPERRQLAVSCLLAVSSSPLGCRPTLQPAD